MVMSRHEFLTHLHELLRPTVYFEIGVQYGNSLNLAVYSRYAIGVDPHPLWLAGGNQVIYSIDSDSFFSNKLYRASEPVDLAFIDGDHHYEQAVRDFYNTQRLCHRDAVIAFDDMLPYNQAVGGRTMVAGHWAGDVWRVEPEIRARQPDLSLALVDVDPTGLLLAWDLDPSYDPGELALSSSPELVPDDVIKRTYALEPEAALDLVSNRGA